MRLIPCDCVRVTYSGTYTMGDNWYIVREFVEGDHDVAEVIAYDHCSPYACAAALNSTIERYRVPFVKANVKRGKVYLKKILHI